jgi:hypothetical protein
MSRSAVLVAQTAVGATVPTALAQATASPLPEIAAGAGLDPDIAAQPIGAMDLILSLEGMARGAKIQRAKIQRAKIQCAKIQCAKSASASNTLSVHPITAANDSRIHDTNSSVPMPTRARHR